MWRALSSIKIARPSQDSLAAAAATPDEHLCPMCHQQFSANCQEEHDTKKPPVVVTRLTLDNWSVFSADSVVRDLLLPQQAEAEICGWLKFIAGQLHLVNNPARLYGKIVFDPLGDLYDFEICKLSHEMLNFGFNNWMNTLASGELLLDIVNGLTELVTVESASSYSNAIKWAQFPVRRMLDTAPNKLAICAFLLNHDCLLRDFLGPILKAMRPIELPAKPGSPVTNVRQAIKMVMHIGHSLLRSSYTTREWTWKALMLVVMTVMALTGSLGEGLETLYCSLTGESDVEQLVVPELHEAYLSLKNSMLFAPADVHAMDAMQFRFPYKRVLKRSTIHFKSMLAEELNLL